MGDLSVTALYTAQTWAWGGLSHAGLFATPDSKRVFDVTNAALGAASVFKRGLAPLRHSLLHRHLMIDHLLAASGHHQVLELAAGLSRRGAAFTDDAAFQYTELDLPPVAAHKRTLLERTPAGRAILARPGLRIVAGDVETEPFEPLAEPGALVVIAEGLMMYLAGDARRRLFAKVHQLGEGRELQFIFDLVPSSEEPAPGVVGRTLEAAMKRFTGGRTFERDARTRAQILDELRAAGFEQVEAIAARDVARAWELPHAEQPTLMVVFTSRARATKP